MSSIDEMMAMADAIGNSNPITVGDDSGNLTVVSGKAPVHNKALNSTKSNVTIDESFLTKHKDQLNANKDMLKMVDDIGNASKGQYQLYNEDLDTSVSARNKALSVLNEAISILSEHDLQYWCPDEATKEAAPKISAILQKFTSRIR